MKKFFRHFGAKSKGSALLVTILLMGVLMMLTLGISTLVIQEIRVTRTVVDSGRAFYSAEAGVENALLALKKNGVGFETADQTKPLGNVATEKDSFDPDFKFNYQLKNTTDKLPAFAPDKPIFVNGGQVSSADDPNAIAYSQQLLYQANGQPGATFQKLGLNKTVLIPLFTENGVGDKKITDFVVEYYVNFKKQDLIGSFQDSKFSLNDLDILRWKIYGKAQAIVNQKTESIADFFPATDTSGPDSPVCLGSDLNLHAGSETCTTPAYSLPDQNGGLSAESTVQHLASAARECYQTDAGSMVTGPESLVKTATQENPDGCRMDIFLQIHDQNYLVLTNMVNPDLLGIGNPNDPTQIGIADIYYRVIVKNDPTDTTAYPKLPRDFAVVEANGFSANGTVRKSIDTYFKASTVLPVFQFSLYNTDTGKQP